MKMFGKSFSVEIFERAFKSDQKPVYQGISHVRVHIQLHFSSAVERQSHDLEDGGSIPLGGNQFF